VFFGKQKEWACSFQLHIISNGFTLVVATDNFQQAKVKTTSTLHIGVSFRLVLRHMKYTLSVSQSSIEHNSQLVTCGVPKNKHLSDFVHSHNLEQK